MRLAMRILAALGLVLPALAASAAEPARAPATAALTAETRGLLVQEMQALGQAMGRIHTAVVTGDHATVAAEARRVHESFVLARELSDAQREEIRTKLPPAFLAADRALHELAARLATAGEEADPRLERLLLQETTRACQSCHAEHGGARFPGLAPARSEGP